MCPLGISVSNAKRSVAKMVQLLIPKNGIICGSSHSVEEERMKFLWHHLVVAPRLTQFTYR